ncbi:MAG: zinc ribbon domain-containing protein, partial [Clostridia bacterium]|nr:zinc ribbon domain-containing protein [Clostridia bacterium]
MENNSMNSGNPKFCIKCGKPIVPGDAFCSFCGERIATTATPNATMPTNMVQEQYETPKNKMSTGAIVALIVVGSLVVVLVAILLLSSNKFKNRPTYGDVEVESFDDYSS